MYFNLEAVPAELDMRVLVYEKYKCVLHMIQERTGAQVTLCGQGSGGVDPSPEPIHLKVQ